MMWTPPSFHPASGQGHTGIPFGDQSAGRVHMKPTLMAIDLAMNAFQVYAANEAGKIRLGHRAPDADRGSLTLRTDHPCDRGLRRGFYPDNADTSEKPDNGSKGVFQCRKEGSSVWSSSGVLLSRSDSPASVAPRLPVNWGLPRIC